MGLHGVLPQARGFRVPWTVADAVCKKFAMRRESKWAPLGSRGDVDLNNACCPFCKRSMSSSSRRMLTAEAEA